MTDSESDLSNSNVFTFQNGNTTVSAKGPNTNCNFSFRNNQWASSMYMPRNFERQRYAEPVSDQRSMYYRRETSPMSMHSACDIRPRNFQQYYNGMGSHQSVFNGRSGSPVSMRSIDSSASVSAADIAFAFKNIKFNKYDLRVIKEAYNKLMKQRFRKRIEKRRNLRLFLKGSIHRSGDDSGEQGSDSSISSDDCRSIKTSYKENMSCNGSTRMNLTDFRKTVRENNMLKDCTENLKPHNLRNMFSVNTSSRNHNINSSSVSKHHSISTLKDRFKNGFVLPSQRFNRSVASSVIPENSGKPHKNVETDNRQNYSNKCISNNQPQNKNCDSGSEEEIFSGISIQEKSAHNTHKAPPSKRNHESDDDSSLPDKKKSRISSPVKNSQTNRKVPSQANSNSSVNNSYENSNNFEFAKPMLPVRKSKPKVQEKVIAKSKQPLTGFVEPLPNKLANSIETVQSTNAQEKVSDNQKQEGNLESTQNSDVSMRPSFIKRKLFTQKLDVAEKANLSSEGMNSPQINGYSALQKEKNKARKLVTSQSCLNREVQEENNLLDLIHKIVPANRMNITNQTIINQTKTNVNNSNKRDDDDEWDVTSVISMCNENDVSDTFTDEDIFESNVKNKDSKKDINENTSGVKMNTTKAKQTAEKDEELPRQCRIVVENMNYNKVTNIKKATDDQNTNLANTNVSNNAVKSYAKTFWDTDFESDAECQLTTKKIHIKDNQTRDNIAPEASSQEFKQPVVPARNPIPETHQQVPATSRWLNNTKNATVMNNTLDSTRKFNISTLSVRSHRTTKKKRCCNETCFQEITSTKSVIKEKSTLKGATNASKAKMTVKNTTNMTQPEIKSKTTSKSDLKNKITKPENSVTKTVLTTIETKKDKEAKNNNKTERNKTPIKNIKSKSNSQNANKSRSSSRTHQKSKENNTKSNCKQIESTLNIAVHQSPKHRRPIRSCRTPSQNRSIENSRSSSQFDISPLTVANRPTRQNKRFNDTSLQEISSKLEINSKSNKAQNKMQTKKVKPNPNISISTLRAHKSPPKPKSKKNKQIPKNIQSNQTPKCGRPIRSCRTPSQNRSIENYKSSIRR